jgi:O-methyltransferase involved in polyketide biosynthesis
MDPKELSSTAYLMAWGRASDPKLSLDPYAHLWLTKGGIDFSERFAKKVTMAMAKLMCLRNRYVVELLKKAEGEAGAITLVNVASGITSYPFIMSDRSSSICIDQPHVIDYYRKKVEKFVSEGKLPKRDIRYISADLNDKKSSEELSNLIAAEKKACVLVFEGILTYLDYETALELVRAASVSLPHGSYMLVHVATEGSPCMSVWKRCEKVIAEELGISNLKMNSFKEDDILSATDMNFVHHIGFRDMEEYRSAGLNFSDDELIDERYFLFERK